MRRSLLPILATGIALLFVTADAMNAQDEGGGRGRGRGGFGGGFGGFGGLNLIDRTRLLGSEQVRKELKLNEEQSKKVEGILASHQEAQRELFQGAPRNRDASDEERAKAREELTAKRTELGKKTDGKLAEVLDKKQSERLDQIVLQQQGPDALVSDKVIAAISLKPEQVEKIKAALATRDEAVRSSFGGGGRRGQGGEGGGGGNREEARAKLEKARKDAETAALAVLSKEQSESFTKLKGEKFELDRSTLPNPGGGRGGFGGPGGPGGPGGGGRGGEGGGNQKKRPPADDEA